MFFTYLRRELRRRMRQAIFISLGLAIGIGLVITVTALSTGVKNAQGTVLHSLYGVGTDITVSQAPAGRLGRRVRGPGSAGSAGTRTRPAPGTTIHTNTLRSFSLAPLDSSAVASIAKMPNVAGVAGGLTLTDSTVCRRGLRLRRRSVAASRGRRWRRRGAG